MNKIYFSFVLFLLLINCNYNADNKNDNITVKEVLTKEQQLKKLYKTTVIPLFKTYKEVDIPEEFKIDTKDNTINAGATFGYIEVSQGLIDYDKTYIQIFALAHELGHIVTLQQAKMFYLGNQIPAGKKNNDYKKAEYLADLIAIHLINEQLPKQKDMLVDNISILQNILRTATYTHPSNVDRIKRIKQYIEESSKKSTLVIFKSKFKEIWDMD